MKNLIQFIIDNYVLIMSITIGVYEVIVRYIPTIKKWSIITLIINIFKFIVPDRKRTSNGNITRHD